MLTGNKPLFLLRAIHVYAPVCTCTCTLCYLYIYVAYKQIIHHSYKHAPAPLKDANGTAMNPGDWDFAWSLVLVVPGLSLLVAQPQTVRSIFFCRSCIECTVHAAKCTKVLFICTQYCETCDVEITWRTVKWWANKNSV